MPSRVRAENVPAGIGTDTGTVRNSIRPMHAFRARVICNVPDAVSMAEYSKEQLSKIVKSVAFIQDMCTAVNIINDSVAMNGDILIKKDVAQIQRAHDLLKDAIQAAVDNVKKETNGEFEFNFESF